MPTTDVSRDWDEEKGLAKESAAYEIVAKGHLAPHRLRRFEGLTVTHQPSGETVLVGSFPDQSALLGLLNWLHDLGIALISVKRLEGTANFFDNRRKTW
jgi:hypothetical protein